jgi:predicted nuclease with TOPRIM domain
MITKCTCNMRQRMLGDGCQYCNPELTIEIMQERIQELEAENEGYVNTITTIRENFAEVWKRNASLNAENHMLKQQNSIECEEFSNLLQKYRHSTWLGVVPAYKNIIDYINKEKKND